MARKRYGSRRTRTVKRKRTARVYVRRAPARSRRSTYRRRGGGNLGRSLNTAIPRTRKCTLTYHDHITIDVGAGLYETHSFACNGLYDPDLTGTGHQPLGYDTLMSMYKYATVIGSKITVTPTQSSITNVTTGYLTIFVDSHGENSASSIFSSGGANTLFESEQRKGNIIHYGEGGAAAWNYRENRSVVAKYSANKMHKKKVLGDAEYRNEVSSNPNEVPRFNVCAFNVGGNNPAPHNFEVHIEYIVVFTEPIALIGS